MTYNYRENVLEDVKNALEELRDYEEITADNYDRLYECLWIDDSVTGNGSGSYTFSSYEAEQNLNGNWGLIEEAAAEFGIEPTISDSWEHGAEWWDVTIRCYLLGECLTEALEELED